MGVGKILRLLWSRKNSAEDGSTKTFTQENLYHGEGQRTQTTTIWMVWSLISHITDGSDTEKAIQNLLGLEGNIISAETVP